MKWRLIYTKHAQRLAKKLAASGLRSKVESFLATVADNPHKNRLPARSWPAILQEPILAALTSNID